MTDRLGYLKESASQTAGPYVHIGLIPKQAGFDIFQNDFSNVLAGRRRKSHPIRVQGRGQGGGGWPGGVLLGGVVLARRDVLQEIWKGTPGDKYNPPAAQQDKPIDDSFRGWGR